MYNPAVLGEAKLFYCPTVETAQFWNKQLCWLVWVSPNSVLKLSLSSYYEK